MGRMRLLVKLASLKALLAQGLSNNAPIDKDLGSILMTNYAFFETKKIICEIADADR